MGAPYRLTATVSFIARYLLRISKNFRIDMKVVAPTGSKYAENSPTPVTNGQRANSRKSTGTARCAKAARKMQPTTLLGLGRPHCQSVPSAQNTYRQVESSTLHLRNLAIGKSESIENFPATGFGEFPKHTSHAHAIISATILRHQADYAACRVMLTTYALGIA